MSAGTTVRPTGFFLALGTLVFSSGQESLGDDVPAALPSDGVHRHDPIDIDARPIISRIKLTLIRPRRLLQDRNGDLYVADWGAGAVLRITPEGESSVVIDNLAEPSGLAWDAEGNLYISTHAGGMSGAGSVVRVSPEGVPTVVATGLSGPTALAFDAMGHLFVANYHDDSIVRIEPSGEVTVFATDMPGPAALAFDALGNLYAASSSEGLVFRYTPDGEATVVARGLEIPSDLALDAKGHLIVANYGGTELTYISDKGHLRTFAIVPKGTIGILFDADDNLVFANWDDHYLMKVTTHLSVPCPHCGKRIPIRLRPKRRPKPTEDPMKPGSPVI